MPYNPDVLVQQISKYITETENGLVFQIPDIPFSIPVSYDDYDALTTRLTEASLIAKMINLGAAIGGMLFLFWFCLVEGAPLMLALPVWLALFIFGFFLNTYVLNKAFDPLRKRLIAAWARESALPEPTFFSAVGDALRSHVGKLIAIAVFGVLLILRAILR